MSSAWWRIGSRNLGRNRRRTLITALGLGVGYFAVVFLVGWADGMSAEILESGTGLLMGQVQLHHDEYLPDRSLYDTIGGREGTDVEALLDRVAAAPGVAAAAPRVYAGGLISSGEATVPGMLMGIDVAREREVSRILAGLARGRLPEGGARELLVGEEMARQLAVEPGSEVVVVAPGADGSMGNDLFSVAGTFHTGMAELDAGFALVPIAPLQVLVALDPGRVHEIAAATPDPWRAPEVAVRLRQALPADGRIEVADWTVLRPEMLEYTRLLESWYYIIIFIVFTVAIFGVANTLLMATWERRREFAVMLALGTTPVVVVLTVVLEALALGVISLAVGAGVTFPLIAWWSAAPPDLGWIYGEFTMFGALIRPSLRVEFNLPVSAWAAVALLVTALLASVYPAARAAGVPPADTLSGL